MTKTFLATGSVDGFGHGFGHRFGHIQLFFGHRIGHRKVLVTDIKMLISSLEKPQIVLVTRIVNTSVPHSSSYCKYHFLLRNAFFIFGGQPFGVWFQNLDEI